MIKHPCNYIYICCLIIKPHILIPLFSRDSFLKRTLKKSWNSLSINAPQLIDIKYVSSIIGNNLPIYDIIPRYNIIFILQKH